MQSGDHYTYAVQARSARNRPCGVAGVARRCPARPTHVLVLYGDTPLLRA